MANITTSRTWFITGASTGFGRLLAEEVLKSGGKVMATARAKLDAWQKEIAGWESTIVGADFPEGE